MSGKLLLSVFAGALLLAQFPAAALAESHEEWLTEQMQRTDGNAEPALTDTTRNANAAASKATMPSPFEGAVLKSGAATGQRSPACTDYVSDGDDALRDCNDMAPIASKK